MCVLMSTAWAKDTEIPLRWWSPKRDGVSVDRDLLFASDSEQSISTPHTSWALLVTGSKKTLAQREEICKSYLKNSLNNKLNELHCSFLNSCSSAQGYCKVLHAQMWHVLCRKTTFYNNGRHKMKLGLKLSVGGMGCFHVTPGKFKNKQPGVVEASGRGLGRWLVTNDGTYMSIKGALPFILR